MTIPSFRSMLDLMETMETKILDGLRPGDEAQVEGFIVKRLPDDANFKFAVLKGDYEEKFYSTDAVLDYIKKN